MSAKLCPIRSSAPSPYSAQQAGFTSWIVPSGSESTIASGRVLPYRAETLLACLYCLPGPALLRDVPGDTENTRDLAVHHDRNLCSPDVHLMAVLVHDRGFEPLRLAPYRGPEEGPPPLVLFRCGVLPWLGQA